MKAQYIVTSNSITVLVNNKPLIIDNTHQNFEAVELAVKNGATENEIMQLMDVGQAVTKFAEVTKGLVKVQDGEIFYNGTAVHSALSVRILALMKEGFDITPFTNFMENLYQNPSFRAVNETYGFLEACNLPITEDGCFLAYKKITADYLDCYTKTIDNSIGAKPELPRNMVDEDSARTCSNGLHVASYSYMAHYPGDRIVICKVNPADVVAVPSDYNNAKMRVCKYEVVNEVDLKDEEIPQNVISDEDAYSPDLEADEFDSHDPECYEDYAEDDQSDSGCYTGFTNIEEVLMAIRQDPYNEIVTRCQISDTDDETVKSFMMLFINMNNRTKNWRNIILDAFSPKEVEIEDNPEVIENTESDIKEDIKEDIDNLSFKEIEYMYSDDSRLGPVLGEITNSTYMWRQLLLNTLEDDELVDAKASFSEKLEDYLCVYDEQQWFILLGFFDSIDLDLKKAVNKAWNKEDLKPLIKKIKKEIKKGTFGKKEILSALEI